MFYVADVDIGSCVFRKKDSITGFHLQKDSFFVISHFPRPDSHHLAFLRLFLDGVGDDDSAFGFLIGLYSENQHTIV
jgi:hypothetical protein